MKYLITKLVGLTTVYEVEAGNTREALKNKEGWSVFKEECFYDEDCMVTHKMGSDGNYKPVILYREDRLSLTDPLVN